MEVELRSIIGQLRSSLISATLCTTYSAATTATSVTAVGRLHPGQWRVDISEEGAWKRSFFPCLGRSPVCFRSSLPPPLVAQTANTQTAVLSWEHVIEIEDSGSLQTTIYGET